VLKVSAIALAGGKSKRLGTDKSLLKIDHEWLLQRILNALATLSDDVFVVANDQEKLAHLAVRVVPDVPPGMGPLGGIYAGLQSMRHERGVFVACDMPFLSTALIRKLARRFRELGCDVLLPRVRGEIEPLHALYHRRLLGDMERILSDGKGNSIRRLFPAVRTEYFDLEDTAATRRIFTNLNTPEDIHIICGA